MRGLIVIPAYNEAESIVNTIEELKEWISQNSQEHVIEYLIIDDGSTDNTKKILQEKNYPYISHCINQGIGGPIKTGIIYAMKNDYDFLLQHDGDGQHQPKYILQMIDSMIKGNDIVIGSRFLDKRKPWTMRMIGSRVLVALLYIKTGFKNKVTDPTSGQRIFSKHIFKELSEYSVINEPTHIAKHIKQGYKITEVAVQMNERKNGNSHFSFVNSGSFMLEQILAILFDY
ncbi:MAG: glycosyltransferase family 2 protein [Mycoplasmatales bacterium]